VLDDKHMTAKEWQEREFLPWKRKMEAYTATRAEQAAQMRKHAASLQAMVAMLVEGRTKQAALAWNTLELHPKLKEVRISPDGETLTLVAMDGTPEVIRLDDILAELQKLLA
jgi:hypothetical protein